MAKKATTNTGSKTSPAQKGWKDSRKQVRRRQRETLGVYIYQVLKQIYNDI